MIPNKFEAFVFVRRVSASCKTFRHIVSARNLIVNFAKMYKDSDLTSKLIEELHFIDSKIENNKNYV